ncbi:hypothetical protein SASPL_120787 [Salvia splendens]|uniref:Inhibitor I9 domain-containing protein n=1 Tax=Salvia splendens TaxID=180675 RepID=A0A8X8XRE4_SALSN|nr:hypothetical protein SASPL_120787 [Salvia splendens]
MKSVPMIPRSSLPTILLSHTLLLSLFLISSMAADSSSSDAKVHIIYTERPEGVEPEQYHIRTLTSVLGSEHVASGFSAKLTPQQFSYLKELLDDELNGEQPGVDGSNRDGERGPGWIATSMNRWERCELRKSREGVCCQNWERIRWRGKSRERNEGELEFSNDFEDFQLLGV